MSGRARCASADGRIFRDGCALPLQFTSDAGNDTLLGGAGRDRLFGGLGADAPYGGADADVFVYTDVAQSYGSSFDTIFDFDASQDRIDLSAIDANSVGGSAGDAFVYVGAAAFSGTTSELRFADCQLQGDTNGDRVADLTIAVSGGAGVPSSALRL